MYVKHSTGYVCVDCLQVMANGHTESEHWNESAFLAWSRDNAESKLEAVLTSSEETDHEFSSSDCDACGTHLAGSRHQITYLEDLPLPVEDKQAREAIDGYRACAIWTTLDEDGESCDHCDLSNEAESELADDMIRFLHSLPRDLVTAYPGEFSQFGHDFWLTRNGHGAGFWDRGHGSIGDALTKWAEVEGTRDTYLNEDTTEIEVY